MFLASFLKSLPLNISSLRDNIVSKVVVHEDMKANRKVRIGAKSKRIPVGKGLLGARKIRKGGRQHQMWANR